MNRQPGHNLLTFSLVLVLFLLSVLGCRQGSRLPQPSWTKSTVLAEREDHPSKILSDGSHLYYVTGGTVASQQQGTNNIKRLSLKDGSVSVLVKGGERIPDPALALDEKFL